MIWHRFFPFDEASHDFALAPVISVIPEVGPGFALELWKEVLMKKLKPATQFHRILASLLITLAANASASIEHSKPEVLTFLAQCKPSTSHEEVALWCQQHSLTRRQPYDPSTGLEIIQNSGGKSAAAILALGKKSQLFEYIEPDFLLSAARTPNDRALAGGQNWGLMNIGQQRGTPDADIDAPEAWDYRTSAENVIVAVIDTGIHYSHEDLNANLWQNENEIPNNNQDDDANGVIDDQYGFNAIERNGNPWDDDGHGTSVSGVIGAVGNNRIGTTGVAWKVQIMTLKFLDASGEGRTSDAISCIDYALAHGAEVINASWGGNGRSRSLERAIRRALARDVLFVTAAGNDRANIDTQPDYPASYSLSNVITVGASTRNDQPSSASNFGMETVDLFAPGSQIYTCNSASDRSYGFASGTSLAAPFVTGALALMIATDPSLSGFELTDYLLRSVDPLPSLNGLAISDGRLNLASALSLVSSKVEKAAPSLTISSNSVGLTLVLSAAPDEAFLLETSENLDFWRSFRRIQAGDDGKSTLQLENIDSPFQFFRIRALN